MIYRRQTVGGTTQSLMPSTPGRESPHVDDSTARTSVARILADRSPRGPHPISRVQGWGPCVGGAPQVPSLLDNPRSAGYNHPAPPWSPTPKGCDAAPTHHCGASHEQALPAPSTAASRLRSAGGSPTPQRGLFPGCPTGGREHVPGLERRIGMGIRTRRSDRGSGSALAIGGRRHRGPHQFRPVASLGSLGILLHLDRPGPVLGCRLGHDRLE